VKMEEKTTTCHWSFQTELELIKVRAMKE
jgi:hypothetical protein